MCLVIASLRGRLALNFPLSKQKTWKYLKKPHCTAPKPESKKMKPWQNEHNEQKQLIVLFRVWGNLFSMIRWHRTAAPLFCTFTDRTQWTQHTLEVSSSMPRCFERFVRREFHTSRSAASIASIKDTSIVDHAQGQHNIQTFSWVPSSDQVSWPSNIVGKQLAEFKWVGPMINSNELYNTYSTYYILLYSYIYIFTYRDVIHCMYIIVHTHTFQSIQITYGMIRSKQRPWGGPERPRHFALNSPKTTHCLLPLQDHGFQPLLQFQFALARNIMGWNFWVPYTLCMICMICRLYIYILYVYIYILYVYIYISYVYKYTVCMYIRIITYSISMNVNVSYMNIHLYKSPPRPPCMLLSLKALHPRSPHLPGIQWRPESGVQGGATWVRWLPQGSEKRTC